MPDDTQEEKSGGDPVEMIRSSLQQALGFLKKLLGKEEKEEEELEEEVGGVGATTGTTTSQTDDQNSED